MGRTITGDFTIGGRGARTFRSKVASMVTTLKIGTPMPTVAEAEMMIADPMQWVQDYRVGQTYRYPTTNANYSNFAIGSVNAKDATQIWLMGDGTSDAYAKIRNQVYASEQNTTPLDMISMVSNDIETVNITGLT